MKAEKSQLRNKQEFPILAPVPVSARACALATRQERIVIHVAASDKEMAAVAAGLGFFAPDREIIEFPAWDSNPYDRASPNQRILAQRIRALSQLVSSLAPQRKYAVLTTLNAVLQKTLVPESLQGKFLHGKVGEELPLYKIIAFLVENSYRRVSKVYEAGEFALRGSILDIFPAGQESPVRLDFLGETLEAIKSFDPISQISVEKLDRISIFPASELLLGADNIANFKKEFRLQFGLFSQDKEIYETIANGARFAGCENLLPLFYPELGSFFDYFKNVSRETFLFLDQAAIEATSDRAALIDEYYQERLANSKDYPALSPEQLYFEGIPEANLDGQVLANFAGGAANEVASDFSRPVYDKTNFLPLLQIGKQVCFLLSSVASSAYLQKLLEKQGLSAARVANMAEIKNVSRETFCYAVVEVETGFATSDILYISEQDLFGDRFVQARKQKKRNQNVLLEAESFEIGELIVHEDHGIGKFVGLEVLEVGGVRHEMIKLVYDNDDRLFVPVENIDLLTRYGADDGTIRLDRLGSSSWQERRARLKNRIKLAAEGLLKIAAERKFKQAPTLQIDDMQMAEFRSKFGFNETEDQQDAIDDVLADLAKTIPMDRLVCGDVGFGKTEVAMRAAFVAAISGVQVALICPTTLLARQHYISFEKRMRDFGIEVRQMSRMVSAAKIKETKTELAQGKVDVVVGTHALLAEDVKFANLGLLIIDEEQRFGVAQKEKIKKLKSNIHVLTLSATPIPRSLQLAISGISELSIIATPPVDRLVVRTFVSVYDELTIKEAIIRENNRGGQVFYVAPRIEHLEEIYLNLRKILPDASIAQAHGQMTPAQLDEVMNQFYDGKFDVLLSTAIVESGLDVPTANTMIIHRADMFGLAQLYQLRGRVGRGKQRGYAYLTMPKRHNLTDNAYKRLEVMQGLDSLGAGFSIASHDMDIRGFGNLLGEEQSGQVKEVGVELYQKMLRETIIRLRAEEEAHAQIAEKKKFVPNINLGISVLIPDYYVEDLDLRMGLYKRAAQLQNEEEIGQFMYELADRFGRLPEEVHSLLKTMRLKQLCLQVGICKIDVGSKAVVLEFAEQPEISPEKIVYFVQKHSERAKIKPPSKILLTIDAESSNEELIFQLEQDLTELAGLVE